MGAYKELLIMEEDDGCDEDGKPIIRTITPRCPQCDSRFNWITKRDVDMKVVCPRCGSLLIVRY